MLMCYRIIIFLFSQMHQEKKKWKQEPEIFLCITSLVHTDHFCQLVLHALYHFGWLAEVGMELTMGQSLMISLYREGIVQGPSWWQGCALGWSCISWSLVSGMVTGTELTCCWHHQRETPLPPLALLQASRWTCQPAGPCVQSLQTTRIQSVGRSRHPRQCCLSFPPLLQDHWGCSLLWRQHKSSWLD